MVGRDPARFTPEQRLELLEEELDELKAEVRADKAFSNAELARLKAIALSLLITLLTGMTIYFLTNGGAR